MDSAKINADLKDAKFNADMEEGWRLVRAMGTLHRQMETASPREIPALKEALIKAKAEWRTHALMCLSTHVQEPNCWCTSCVGIRSQLREEDEASYRPPISQAWLDDQAAKEAARAQAVLTLDADAEADAFLRTMI